MISLVTLLLLLVICSITQSRLIISPDESFDFDIERNVKIAQLWTFNDVAFVDNITGPLSWYEYGDGGCEGRILLVGLYTFYNIDHFVTCGALAVVFQTRLADPGLIGAEMRYLGRREGYTFPTFEVSIVNEGWAELRVLMEEGGRDINITITPEENENIWEISQSEKVNGVRIAQYVLFTYSMIVFCIAGEKLVFTCVSRNKNSNNLSMIIMIVEMIANLFRAIYLIVDPVAARGIFSVQFSFYALQVTAPISSLTATLLILYWFEALSHSDSLFSKYKVVIFVMLGILFTFGVLVLPLLFILAINFIVLYIMLVFYFLIGLLLAIYTFYSTPSMYAIINKMKANRQPSYEWQANTVVISAVVLLCWCLSTFGILLFSSTMTGYFGSVFVWLGLLISVSLAQLLVFTPEFAYFRGPTTLSSSMSKKSRKDGEVTKSK